MMRPPSLLAALAPENLVSHVLLRLNETVVGLTSNVPIAVDAAVDNHLATCGSVDAVYRESVREKAGAEDPSCLLP
jgi:hypothetical protein